MATNNEEYFEQYNSHLKVTPLYSDAAIIGTESLYNDESIEQSFKTILLTKKGERIFRPDFGCNLEPLLWRFIDDDTAFLIRNEIVDALRQDSRLRYRNVSVTAVPDENTYYVKAEFDTDTGVVALSQTIKAKKI